VNGFDVHAVGWIVTRDLWCEAARVFLGLKRTLPTAGLDALGKRWQNLGGAVHDDRLAMDGWLRLMSPRRAPLSGRSEQAMEAFIGHLIAFRPQRYGYQALRSRCFDACLQLVVSGLCCWLVGQYASADHALLGEVALILFVLSCWSLMVAIQLWRMCRIVARIEARHLYDPGLQPRQRGG